MIWVVAMIKDLSIVLLDQDRSQPFLGGLGALAREW